ncbi:hypothetical protein DFJ77DRAFT_550036 [Powellomyces hirtus]|nr:hypothetical protein DFJ77DRAFT_550036 [Powellomyces hirtus]
MAPSAVVKGVNDFLSENPRASWDTFQSFLQERRRALTATPESAAKKERRQRNRDLKFLRKVGTAKYEYEEAKAMRELEESKDRTSLLGFRQIAVFDKLRPEFKKTQLELNPQANGAKQSMMIHLLPQMPATHLLRRPAPAENISFATDASNTPTRKGSTEAWCTPSPPGEKKWYLPNLQTPYALRRNLENSNEEKVVLEGSPSTPSLGKGVTAEIKKAIAAQAAIKKASTGTFEEDHTNHFN